MKFLKESFKVGKDMMSKNDMRIISTAFDSNLSARIERVTSVLDDLSDFDLTLLDSKVLKKEIETLKKLLNKSKEIVSNIDGKYYNYKN